jgi:hypothetical protein
MFYTVEGEVEELETLLQIYRNKIVETIELENDALNNGRMNHVSSKSRQNNTLENTSIEQSTTLEIFLTPLGDVDGGLLLGTPPPKRGSDTVALFFPPTTMIPYESPKPPLFQYTFFSKISIYKTEKNKKTGKKYYIKTTKSIR